MIVLLTGTPGTGKSTVAKILSERLGYRLIGLNEWINEAAREAIVGYDKSKDTKVIDIELVRKKIKGIKGNVIIEGHLSHLSGIGDIVVVLRAHPRVLRRRLKGFSDSKRQENIEAEALDVCLIESIENNDASKVFEVDTTDKQPDDVADAVIEIVEGRGDEYKPGKIDWSEELRP